MEAQKKSILGCDRKTLDCTQYLSTLSISYSYNRSLSIVYTQYISTLSISYSINRSLSIVYPQYLSTSYSINRSFIHNIYPLYPFRIPLIVRYPSFIHNIYPFYPFRIPLFVRYPSFYPQYISTLWKI
jgi:hypothetical protein